MIQTQKRDDKYERWLINFGFAPDKCKPKKVAKRDKLPVVPIFAGNAEYGLTPVYIPTLPYRVGQVVNWKNPKRGYTTQCYTICDIKQQNGTTWYTLNHPYLGRFQTVKEESIRSAA